MSTSVIVVNEAAMSGEQAVVELTVEQANMAAAIVERGREMHDAALRRDVVPIPNPTNGVLTTCDARVIEDAY